MSQVKCQSFAVGRGMAGSETAEGFAVEVLPAGGVAVAVWNRLHS